MNVSDLQKVIYTYKLYLKRRDLSDNTIERYVNDLKILIKNENTSDEINTAFMNRRINELLSDHKISSVNSYIITYNAFFKWCKMPIHLDALPTQKVTSIQNIITKEDYLYLMEYASQNNKDWSYVKI